MRIIATIVSVGACAIAVLASAGCGNTGPAELTTEPAAPPAGVQNDEPAPTAAGGAQQWAMPDLVGSVLQDAQDRIQALTGDAVYLTGSHDLRGENRNQVLDANWTVCTQNVPPGAAVTPASRIDFGVVKIDEACP